MILQHARSALFNLQQCFQGFCVYNIYCISVIMYLILVIFLTMMYIFIYNCFIFISWQQMSEYCIMFYEDLLLPFVASYITLTQLQSQQDVQLVIGRGRPQIATEPLVHSRSAGRPPHMEDVDSPRNPWSDRLRGSRGDRQAIAAPHQMED